MKYFRSGTEEEYDEKQHLLHAMSELAEKAERNKEKSKRKESDEQKGKDIRKRALETLSPKTEGNVQVDPPCVCPRAKSIMYITSN